MKEDYPLLGYEQQHRSSFSVALTLTKCIFGSGTCVIANFILFFIEGIIALPYAFQQSGYLVGIILLAIIALLSVLSTTYVMLFFIYAYFFAHLVILSSSLFFFFF